MQQCFEERLNKDELEKIHATARYIAACVDLSSEEEIRSLVPEEAKKLSFWGKSIVFPMLKVYQLKKPLSGYSERRVHDALLESFFPEFSEPDVVVSWRCAPGSERN